MINENTLEHFRQKSFAKVSEIERKQVLLKEKLSQRSATAPQEGDIFVFKHPETLGIQWVVLRVDAKRRLLVVPADDTPMVGSTDIELPKSALCSPLTLRCDYGLLVEQKQFDMNLRVGILEERHRQRALDKLKQISAQNVRSSILQQEIDDDLDYEEWMEQVYRAREALIIQSPASETVPLVFWISKIYQTLKNFVTFPPRLAWASAGVAVITLFIVLLFPFLSPSLEQQINQSYHIYSARAKNSQVIQTILSSTSSSNSRAFSSSSLPPTPARQAFDAGFQVGMYALNPSLISTTYEKDWQQSEWKIFFELGRWTLLLETVSLAVYKSQYEVPKTFWVKQRQIFDMLQEKFKGFKVQLDTNQEAVEWVVVDSLPAIEPLLQRLPSENEPAIYARLVGELRDMREELP